MAVEGKIARINPAVETASRTFQVETLVPNERGLLRPGGFAKASIIIDAESKAAVVPTESIIRFAGVTKLFIVEQGKAHSISDIQTGAEGRGWVEVTSKQLPEIAQIVTTGQTQLAEGTPVVIREPEPAAEHHPGETSTIPETARAPRRSSAARSALSNARLERLTVGTSSFHSLYPGIAMTLSDVCINRPVFTWVLVAIPVVLGLFSYGELGVDLFPDVDFPVCTVTTVLQGASVEEMETTVTKPIEDIINTVSGIDELRSTTTEGVSIVTVQFLLSKNGDVGMQEVRDKVNTILADLPDGTDPPIVDKFDTSSMPVMTIAISGRRDFREVTEIGGKQIKERLETVNGVGSINLVGGRVRAMNVVLDTERLAGYNLSVEDVRMALARQNLEVPGGRMDQGARELVLRTLGRLRTQKEFNNMIVANRNGYPIRLSDVGRADDSFEEPRTQARLDGESAVSLVVQKQSGVNTVKVVEDVRARLDLLKAVLPADITPEVIRDQSRFIKKSIEEVKFHLLLAAVLVSATILLFIRDWRTTLIATLAIPTSIIPTFMFMRYMGFTLNNITMLGLILAIGIVIDDAVVVHENIFRHMEEDGMDGMAASRKGTREIALAVLATSLSLVVIFVPIAFMGGIVGRFFSSFGLTVAFAVMMSLFVSFTLTPMLCSRFLKLEPAPAGAAHEPKSKSGIFYRLIDGAYGVVLKGAMRHKFLVVALTAVVIYSTAPIGRAMGISLIPRDDQSEYEISVTTPEGYSLERHEPAHSRAGIADMEAQGDRARLYHDRPDGRWPRGQGRRRRHAGDDLRPDHRSRKTSCCGAGPRLVGCSGAGAPIFRRSRV